MKATTDSDKWDIVLSVLNDSQEVFYQDKRAAAALKYGKELRAAGGGLRELLDKRHNEWRDACDERDLALARAEAAEALAHERLEAALFAEQRATDAEALIRELTDAQTSELEPDSDWLAIVAAQRDRAEARVAELKAQLAEQAWRPVNTPPEATGEYEIGADYIPDVRRAEYHADTNMWYQQMSDGEWQLADWATHWRPLPPAPDAQEPTP